MEQSQHSALRAEARRWGRGRLPLPRRLPAPQPGLDPREPGAARPGPPRWSRAQSRAAPAGVAVRACRRPAAPPARARRAQTPRSGRSRVPFRVEIFKCLRLLFDITGARGAGRGFCLKVSYKREGRSKG